MKRQREALFDLAKPRKARSADTDSLLEQIAAAGLPQPEEEMYFAKVLFGRNWRFDFGWRDPYRIALEIEGAFFGSAVHVGDGAFKNRTVNGVKTKVPIAAGSSVRIGGGHNTGAGLVSDLEKYNTAAMLGWMVIRVSTTQVRDCEVIPILRLAFAYRDRYCPLGTATALPSDIGQPCSIPPAAQPTGTESGINRLRRAASAASSNVPW